MSLPSNFSSTLPSSSAPPPSGRHVGIRLAAMVMAAVLFILLDFTELSHYGSISFYASPLQTNVYRFPHSYSKDTKNVEEIEEEYVDDVGAVIWRGAPWKKRVGSWLAKCWTRNSAVDVTENLGGAGCPGSCGGHGICDFATGECRCSSGFKGDDCQTRNELECNVEPIPHISEGKMAPWIFSACLDQAGCDKKTGTCRCGNKTPFPMRPLPSDCGVKNTGANEIHWDDTLRDELFSNDTKRPGWCFANPEKLAQSKVGKYCYCTFDGQAGALCHITTRQYCVNGCNNLGTCRHGFCECKNGWYGIDCSIPSKHSPLEDQKLIPWLFPPATWFPISIPEENRNLLGEGAGTTNKEADMATYSKPKVIESGDDKDVGIKLVLGGGNKGLLIRRRRPLIYVYELPGEFNFQLLEGRGIGGYCVPWLYDAANKTVWHEMLYGMEPVLIEAFLSSQHRTTNPEEADYFFVPVFANCVIFRADENPHLNMQIRHNGIRPYFLADFIIRAHEYIRNNFPYWNRTDGRDHLWILPWDEGSCHAPHVIRNSTLLSSFGNTNTRHKSSTTAYYADNWDAIPFEIRGSHPCFDPQKDVVLPAWKPPHEGHIRERLWTKSFDDRPNLFYFKGNLGPEFKDRPEPRYSMGIRQIVAKYFASTPNVEGKFGEKTEPGVIVTNQKSRNYGEELSSSRFCGAFPGDGFSARVEDSILHGCIPVIIQDGIQMPFENFLDYASFSVRISEDDIPSMVEILKAIPEEKVRSMLDSVQKNWQRWTYFSVVRLQSWREREWYGNSPGWTKSVEEIKDHDAVSTLFQILHYKLYNDKWRRIRMRQSGRSKGAQKCFK